MGGNMSWSAGSPSPGVPPTCTGTMQRNEQKRNVQRELRRSKPFCLWKGRLPASQNAPQAGACCCICSSTCRIPVSIGCTIVATTCFPSSSISTVWGHHPSHLGIATLPGAMARCWTPKGTPSRCNSERIQGHPKRKRDRNRSKSKEIETDQKNLKDIKNRWFAICLRAGTTYFWFMLIRLLNSWVDGIDLQHWHTHLLQQNATGTNIQKSQKHLILGGPKWKSSTTHRWCAEKKSPTISGRKPTCTKTCQNRKESAIMQMEGARLIKAAEKEKKT